jgi:hypothetical protein
VKTSEQRRNEESVPHGALITADIASADAKWITVGVPNAAIESPDES